MVPLKVLIIGASGQDGRHLAKIALENGDSVFGVVRKVASAQIMEKGCEYLIADCAEVTACNLILNSVKPDVIFHVAASHANSSNMKVFQESYSEEIYSSSLEIAQNILDWQKNNLPSRSVMALSSHMYSGSDADHFVDENSIPMPVTDYGIAKAKTFALLRMYRESFHVKSSGAILFNHTSTFGRGDFIFPVLADQICDVLLDKSKEIRIKNFDAVLDISDAREICEAMYRISHLTSPEDFVLGSGHTMKIKDITQQVLSYFHAPTSTNLISTEIDSETLVVLTSNTDKAKRVLSWNTEIDPVSLLIRLVTHRLASAQNEF